MTNSEKKNSRTRTCLVTRETIPASKLIRFACSRDGEIVPDVASKLPGRGGWVRADRDTVQKAIDNQLLMNFGKKALSSSGISDQVHVAKNLLDLIENLLFKRCMDFLGLANRAGNVITGFEKVRKILKSGKSGILIIASDAAEGSRSKITQGLDNLQIIDMFARNDLSKALGQENAVHLAMLPGGISRTLLDEISRYDGCRKKDLN